MFNIFVETDAFDFSGFTDEQSTNISIYLSFVTFIKKNTGTFR